MRVPAALPDGEPTPGPGTGAAAGPAAVAGTGAAAGPARRTADRRRRAPAPGAVAGAGDTTDWPAALAVAAGTALAAGRGAVLVVPDHRDVDRVDAALRPSWAPASTSG